MLKKFKNTEHQQEVEKLLNSLTQQY